MRFWSPQREIGVDMGSSRTRIFVPQKGIVFDEPSIISIERETGEMLCIGGHSRSMSGKAPKTITVHRTVERGVVNNQKITQIYLSEAFKRIRGIWRFIRNDALVNIPIELNNMGERTIIDVCRKADVRDIYRENSVLLAALGAESKREREYGRMIADLGAGLTEVAVVSFGGIHSRGSVKIGGDDMDIAIVKYIQQNYHISISIAAAKEIKEKIGSVILLTRPKEVHVKGSDLQTKLPRVVKVNSNDIANATIDIVKKIIEVIGMTFENTPPEITSDIIDYGVLLTGGLANIPGIDIVIHKEVNAPVYIAEQPDYAVIRGIGKTIQTGHLHFHKKMLLSH